MESLSYRTYIEKIFNLLIYIHPLWLILLIPVYALTKQAYFTVLFVSFVCSLAALLLIRYKTEAPIFPLAILLLSKAFMDYSASGLENPATHLLLVIFWLGLLHWERNADEQKDIYPLSLIGALLVLNRLDTILFLIPVFAFLLYKIANTKTWLRFAYGLAPLVVWEAFSLFYYGFLFPNTYYAKLNTDIPHAQLIEQGLVYFVDSLQRDPLTLTIIFAGILIAFWRSNKSYEKLLALGNLIYLSYILSKACWFPMQSLRPPLSMTISFTMMFRTPISKIFAWNSFNSSTSLTPDLSSNILTAPSQQD